MDHDGNSLWLASSSRIGIFVFCLFGLEKRKKKEEN